MEGALGALALGAVVAAPGLLAILAIKDRPALLLPAAIVLIPLSFISFALVTLPLLIPAGLLMVGYRRRGNGKAGGTAGTVVVVFALLVAAFLVLFAHADPRSYTTSTVSGSTSDVITFAESIASLGLTACAVLAGWALSGHARNDAVGVVVEDDGVDAPLA